MKPVYQTTFGSGKGNCFSACLASLLEIPVLRVPDFCALYDDTRWMDEANRWLWQFGYGLAVVSGADATFTQTLSDSGGYVIAFGRPKRGEELHAVVMQRGECIHDPMPGGEGLAHVTALALFWTLNPVSPESLK